VDVFVTGLAAGNVIVPHSSPPPGGERVFRSYCLIEQAEYNDSGRRADEDIAVGDHRSDEFIGREMVTSAGLRMLSICCVSAGIGFLAAIPSGTFRPNPLF
jgi:hypothetical protein